MAWPTSLVGDCLKICPAVCQKARRPKSRLKHGLDLLYFSGCSPQERFQSTIFGIRSTWESGSASSYQEKLNKLPWIFVVRTTTRHGSLVKSWRPLQASIQPYKGCPADCISFQRGWFSSLDSLIKSIMLWKHIGRISDSNADTSSCFYAI